MTLLARAILLVLIGATFGAFFVAQELKSRPAVVAMTEVTRFFSPNGDGRRDVARMSVEIQEADEISAAIVDADGTEVRRLFGGEAAQAYTPVRVRWDGRMDDGARAPDGLYRLRVDLREQARSVVVPGAVTLDTTAPDPLVRRVEDDRRVVAPGRRVAFYVRGAGSRRAPDVAVWRTDVTPARKVADLRARRGNPRVTWDGRVDGRPAPPGVYLVEATVVDRSGNAGSSASGLPELPPEVRGAPGVTVRALAVQLPPGPVRAGARTQFLVDARGREYAWSIRRVGGSRPVAEGRSNRIRLRVRAPRGVSGAYLLELRSVGHATAVPFLVQAERRAPLLVVLPAMTWLGLEPSDESADGLPDTLARGEPVPLDRLFDGLPAGFGDEVAPLLVFLDRARVRYDLTTDLRLAFSRDPRPTDRPGVLLAGAHRWIPPDLGRRLRDYALRGGRVASFGTDTLRRGVTLTPRLLRAATAPSPDDVFGARIDDVRTLAGAPLEPIAEDPDLGLLTGTDGVVTGFSRAEESRPDERGRGRLLAALGRQVSEAEAQAAETEGTPVREPLPALAATRFGDGLVVRVGLPEWPARIFEDAEVGQLHRNIVDLARGARPRPRAGVG